MPAIPFYMAGDKGIIKDVAQEELPPNAWNEGLNVRFDNGKVINDAADLTTFGVPLGANGPYWNMSVLGVSGNLALWVYASLDHLYATDGANHADVSRTVGGVYDMRVQNLWSGGILSQIPVITNFIDKPQMWLDPQLSTDFQDLSAWPVNDRCKVIKPFKSFLVALNINRSGTNYRHLVKWSHPAVPGAVPSSWDETDPTKLAGEVELLDGLPGGIQDGKGLRDTFIIYKDNAIWGMQYIGGNSIFRFAPIFLRMGILATGCVCEVMDGAMHFVATGEDLIIHDGQQARSVIQGKLRSYMNNAISETSSFSAFVFAKPLKKEAWFCFPEQGAQFPTLAIVWNWERDVCYLRNFGDGDAQISSADVGPVGTAGNPWNTATTTWDTVAQPWDQALFSPHFAEIIATSPNRNSLYNLQGETTALHPLVSFVRRTGIPFTEQDRVTGAFKADNAAMKLLHRIWVKGSGTSLQVRVGSQQFLGDTIDWSAFVPFVPGVDNYLDMEPRNGRYLAIEFANDAQHDFSLDGYDLEVEVVSNL